MEEYRQELNELCHIYDMLIKIDFNLSCMLSMFEFVFDFSVLGDTAWKC